MKAKSTYVNIAAIISMLVLIFDSKTALAGAKEGINLCINTVIPSLLPFFVITSMLTSSLSANHILKPLRKLCGLPAGTEPILAIGLIGGYPVGAKSVAEAYTCGSITKQEAKRMLGFCNNAGPSYIFGMTPLLFSSQKDPWILWLVTILSAIIVGAILPEKSKRKIMLKERSHTTITQSLASSLRAIASVCGWIILFRVIIRICSHWFLWYLPDILQTFFHGLLELTNGCLSLEQIPFEPLRFVICAGFLSFGGLCVAMQTSSVTETLGITSYFQGKVLQTAISMLLATWYQLITAHDCRNELIPYLLPLICSVTAFIFLTVKPKKVIAFFGFIQYNKCKNKSKGSLYAISEKD